MPAPAATSPRAPAATDSAPIRLPIVQAYSVVFLSSACSLILEIVAGRILAPYIGVSLYTWTSIIGVVLAGISLGNYVGGRVADRWSSQRTLGIILLAGGLASLLVLPLTLAASNHDLFWLDCTRSSLGAICTPQLAIMVKIVLLTALIFFLPSFILGMVSPVVVRLSLSNLATSGNTVGKIYALSTLGSIVGTFLTGFWLIPTFGTRVIVLGVGALLVIMAVLLGNLWRVRRPSEGFVNIGGAFLLFCLIGLIDRTQAMIKSGCYIETGYYRETGYYCIKAYDQAHGDRVLRTLTLDHLVHSYSDMTDPTYYEYAYVKVYAEITEYLARQRPDYHALFIGGGGYTLPRGMVISYPESSVEVVEIDPGVTQTAYDQMGIDPTGPIITHNVDARLYFDQIQGGPKVDLVFGDAFNDLSVPYHLTTREFDQQVRNVLRDDGFYLVNVIDKLNGGLFIPSFVRTLKTVFPHVYLMSAGTPWFSQVSAPNTFIVVGTATPLDLDRLRRVQTQSTAGSVVTNVMPTDLMEQWLAEAPGVTLTDDFAPADNLVAPLFAERGLQRLPVARRNFLAALVLSVTMMGCTRPGRFELLMQDSAMEPTYSARTPVHFRPATRAERGEVIAFEYPFPYPGRPRRELIARVVGLPGDRLELSPEGTVVNGRRIDEPYSKNLPVMTPAELTVPAESYYVLGDDRANQRDSRWWGPLPATKLLGVAEPQVP